MARARATSLSLKTSTVFGACLPVTSQPTFSTRSMASGFGVDARGVRNAVQARTTQFTVLVTGPASRLVHETGDGLQVPWIDATTDPASMIKFQVHGDRSHVAKIEGSVGHGGTQERTTETSVALGTDASLPEPAALMVNCVASPVIDQGRRVDGGALLAETLVVLWAQPEADPFATATGTTYYTYLHGNQSRVSREVTPK